jgi:hypothetical protein
MRLGCGTNERRRRLAVKLIANRLIKAGRTFGPYLAIELVMPGGSLLALLLWLYRMHARTSSTQARA